MVEVMNETIEHGWKKHEIVIWMDGRVHKDG